MNKNLWWQEGIIYEIYVRSFQDSNGDGIGDIPGIISRLDYLQWLGIKAIWLTPVYPSPMKDFGYDICDYCNIDPLFGSMADFDELLGQVHSRNMKVIMDLVPNHTSDQHPWFLESRASKDNAKRDWYFWKNAIRDEIPPNNWRSQMGGSAWEWDTGTDQYYYHSFLKEQPDLNLRNPNVVNEILKIMRFWLDKGVDGFRIDVIWYLIKDKYWRNNPPNPDYKQSMPDCKQLLSVFSCDQSEVHDLIRKMRQTIDEYDERVMIGEIYLPENKVISYYGNDSGLGVHLPANFHLMFTQWDATNIAAVVGKYEAAISDKFWPHWVIGNHDQPRLISRIGREQIFNAALLHMTLRGTPTIYYGDELGMEQTHIPPNKSKDPQGLYAPDKHLNRDPQRTPMQWNTQACAGFSEATPWLPVNANFPLINIENEKQKADSLLNLYKRLIKLRNEEPSLNTGEYFPVNTGNSIFAFIRYKEGSTPFLILINLADKKATFNSDYVDLSGTQILSTLLSEVKEISLPDVVLQQYEGIIIAVNNTAIPYGSHYR
jgi:alpha-glucosidase